MNARLQACLRLSLDAADYAHDTAKPPEHFAVELADLMAAGVLHMDVQWLLAKGHVKSVGDDSQAGQPDRSAKADSPRNLSARMRFVLTASGIRLARQISDTPLPAESHGRRKGRTLRIDAAQKNRAGPHWDSSTRRLFLGETLVKQFLVPAKNQEAILEAFERLGWPECIDNPLADGDETSAQRRLHNAITRLNHQQIHPIIRFHGTGTGTGVRWEPVATQEAPSRNARRKVQRAYSESRAKANRP
jgi:hypothetical protein